MRSRKRAAVSELVSSLAVLAITVALLGAIGAVAVDSLRSSSQLLSSGSQGEANEDGVLIALVSVQSNSSGSYAWVYDYGWVAGHVSAAYINGGSVEWGTSCDGNVEPGSICAISLPAGEHGQVSVIFGTRSLDFQV